MNAEHVIFGAGSIGLATAAVLSERGAKLLLVNRSGGDRPRADRSDPMVP